MSEPIRMQTQCPKCWEWCYPSEGCKRCATPKATMDNREKLARAPIHPKDVGQGRRLWPVGGRFCISVNDCWIPGTYATEAAAMQAFDLPDETLSRLAEEYAPNPIPASALGGAEPEGKEA